jgi:hypothetical protein
VHYAVLLPRAITRSRYTERRTLSVTLLHAGVLKPWEAPAKLFDAASGRFMDTSEAHSQGYASSVTLGSESTAFVLFSVCFSQLAIGLQQQTIHAGFVVLSEEN